MGLTDKLGSLSEIATDIKTVANGVLRGENLASDAANSLVGGYQEAQTTNSDEKGRQTSGRAQYCSNCGTQLNDNAKFCHVCGSMVGTGAPLQASSDIQPPPIPQSQTQPPVQDVQPQSMARQQEYVGTVFKCPHCGSAIDQTMAICPECGNHITGQEAVQSVRKLSDQLMQLEMSRKNTILNAFHVVSNPVDNQILMLIKSFPIPNSIDDIQEFVLLASTNIDVSLSKRGIGKSLSGVSNYPGDPKKIAREKSDAWVAKLQQAYQKAKLSFPDEPVFQTIREIYFGKMKELKIKVED